MTKRDYYNDPTTLFVASTDETKNNCYPREDYNVQEIMLYDDRDESVRMMSPQEFIEMGEGFKSVPDLTEFDDIKKLWVIADHCRPKIIFIIPSDPAWKVPPLSKEIEDKLRGKTLFEQSEQFYIVRDKTISTRLVRHPYLTGFVVKDELLVGVVTTGNYGSWVSFVYGGFELSGMDNNGAGYKESTDSFELLPRG